MTWHIEPLMAHARRFIPGKSYANWDEFASIVAIQFLNGTTAYLSGMLNDGTQGPIHPEDWRDLQALLRDKYGITRIQAQRHHKTRDFDTGQAPLAPDIELP